jgi:nucleotide-binding universal stress UspA family protein
MVFFVPFDGSASADAALRRAVEHGRALDREVVAVSFVPTGSEFAERRKWITPADDFAADEASAALKRKIEETTDETELVYEETSAGSPDDGIGEEVRRAAEDVDASILFVGAGDSSVGDGLRTRFGTVASTGSYDVHIVRSA